MCEHWDSSGGEAVTHPPFYDRTQAQRIRHEELLGHYGNRMKLGMNIAAVIANGQRYTQRVVKQ